MAWAETPTLLPLDTWATIMGIDPWEFNGFLSPRTSRAECKDTWRQFEWQKDTLSREEVARTIEAAEAAIAEEVNTWPAPYYVTNEAVQYPRPAKEPYYGMAGTPRGQYKATRLRYCKIQGGGIRARTLIDIDANVNYSDPDSDTIKDKATITVTTTITDSSEIGVYFQASDRLGEALTEKWRIRPITVTFSGGVATIQAHASQFALPKKLVDVDFEPLDANDVNNYVIQVEVYRVYRDATFTSANPNQGTAEWEVLPCNTTPCAVDYIPLCLGARSPDNGIVMVAFDPNSSFPQWREPDRMHVNYLAGYPLVDGKMQSALARMTAQLATAWLTQESCACDRSSRIIHHWRSLPSSDDKDTRPITAEEINENPWGPRRGAYFAWRKARMLDTRFLPVIVR